MKHSKFSLVKIFHLILMIIFLGLSSNSFAQKSYNFSFTKSALDIKNIKADNGNEYQQISINGLELKGRPGTPNLPVKQLRLLISPYEDVESIVVNIKKSEMIHLSKKLYPAQYFISPGEKFILPNKDIYESEKFWPNELAQLTKNGFFASSYHIVNIEITPIRYYPKTDQIELISELEVIMKMKALNKNLFGKVDQEFYKNDLKYLIDNVEDIPRYSNMSLNKNLGVKKVTTLPIYDYVIITRSNLAQYFQKFMDWKKRKGLNIGLITVEDILSNYPNGDLTSGIVDSAGSIRQYLTDSSPTTKWALLGGDYHVVPVRYGAGDYDTYTIYGVTNSAKIPNDLYFAELDSDWDADGLDDDEIRRYGEPPTNQYFSGDITDYYPEIYVGRLLCSRSDQTGAQDILNWTEKVIKYEQNPGNGITSYLTRVLMHQSDEIQNAHWLNLTKNNLPQTLQSGIDSLSEVPSYSAADPTSPSGSQIINQMNNTKYGLWYWFNHGTPVGVAVATYGLNSGGKYGITPLDSYPIGSESGNGFDNLTNQNYPAIVYTIACEVTPFDDWDPHGWWSGYRNLGEGFTVMNSTGGPAFLGNTRYGLGSSGNLAKDFAELLGNENNTYLGKAEMLSRANHYEHYAILSHNLIGCPETRIWTETPSSFSNATVTDNGSSISVSAGVSGCNIVACSIDNGATYFSEVESGSSATFTTAVRPLFITITKPNYLPFVGISGGTITSSTTFNGILKVMGNLTVNSGVTLTIDSNAIIDLNNYSITTANGTITVEGGATINGLRAKLGQQGQNGLCSSIQTAIDYSDYNNSIYIQSGSFNENINIINKSSTISVYGAGKNSTFVYGYICIANSSYPQLYYLTTNYLGIGSSTNARVEEVIIIPYSEEAEWSLMVNNCSPLYLGGITLNDTPWGYGAYFYNSAGQVNPINGTNFENNELSTYFINNSSFTLDQVHFCNNDYDIVTDGGSSVSTQNVTFSGDPNYTTTGNVTWDTTDVDICGLMKNSSSMISNADVKKDFAYGKFQKLNVLYQDLLTRINAEQSKDHSFNKANYSNDFSTIINECKKFITVNSASAFAATALSIACHTYKQFDDYEGMKTFLTGIMADKNLVSLSGYTKRNMIDYYSYLKDYATAIYTADEIISDKAANQDLLCDALFAKGFIYEYSLGNKEEAVNTYSVLVKNYPDNPLAKFAKQQLKKFGVDFGKETPKIANKQEEKIAFGSSNYPNPFNPSTTINYTIPEDGKVMIKVFDVLGREVTTLVNEFTTAGKHNVVWNGTNFASAIYFYSITFKGETLNKKMLLVK